jgi:hypothetical protein
VEQQIAKDISQKNDIELKLAALKGFLPIYQGNTSKLVSFLSKYKSHFKV